MMSTLEGGGGGSRKADKGWKAIKGGCLKMRTRGEGVITSRNFADVINGSPLSLIQPFSGVNLWRSEEGEEGIYNNIIWR